MRLPAFRILRQLKSGRRVDVPHPLQPDTDGYYQHATSPAAAIQQARAFGLTGELVAVETDEDGRLLPARGAA